MKIMLRMMNVVRNIFLYFEIIRGKKDKIHSGEKL